MTDTATPGPGGAPAHQHRVLVVGFDAMDRDLATALVGAGEMPNLARLLAEGRSGPVTTPLGFVVGGVWPSYNTALGPARHGRHCYAQLIPGTYEAAEVTPWGIDGRPWWHELSDAGVRYCNVDVPFAVPRADPNGVQVVDWGTHDRRIPFVTEPACLADDILERHGPHDISLYCDDLVRAGRWEDLRAALLAGARARTDMVTDLASRHDAEVIQVVFAESHCAGHQFWVFHDPRYRHHTPVPADRLGDPLVEVYRSLDAELGRLVESFPDHLVIVLLSHGMAAHHDGDHLMPELLRRLDASRAAMSTVGAAVRSVGSAKDLIRSVVPRRVLDRWYRTAIRSAIRGSSVVRNRRASRFFHHFNNTVYSGIRFNLIGREPQGRVEPAEVDGLVEWLRDELGRVTDTRTGRPVVAGVIRVSDHMAGPYLDDLPDLLVDWARDSPIEDVSSPTVRRLRIPYLGPRTGDHRPGGLIVAAGPGSERLDLSDGIDTVDIGPTIAALFGVELDDVDGVPRTYMATR